MCGILVLLIRKPNLVMLRVAFVLTVILELAGFAWYGQWRFESPPAQAFQKPEIVRRAVQSARRMNTRWLSPRGILGEPAEAPADLSALWRLPSLSKYGPLLPVRYGELMGMTTPGRFPGRWWATESRAIDITAGRLVVIPTERPHTDEFRGVNFLTQDLAMSAGNGCGAVSRSTTIPVLQPQEINGLALVTLTACSVGLEQGTPVAEVRLQEPSGASIPILIRAGLETAEWAAACSDVAPAMRHRAADVYSRHAVRRGAGVCQAQSYAAVLRLSKPITVASLQFQWLLPSEGRIKIEKITMLEAKTGASHPLSERDVQLGDRARWRLFDQADGVEVYENLRAQPRAWFVPETVTALPAQIMRAIQTSRLPDGRPFDPAKAALIEEPLAFRDSSPDSNARAAFLRDDGSSDEIRTSGSRPAFLVLADFYYPGWQATINGKHTHIFQTNYIQRGILLPAGENSVRFEFRPLRFYAAAAISLGSLAGMLCTLIVLYRRGRSASSLGPRS
jgi:hypothetical protein